MDCNENSIMDRTSHTRRAALIVIACTLAVAVVLSLKKDKNASEFLSEDSKAWAKTVISKAFQKPPGIPIFIPDVSAAEKGFEAAKEAAHLFHIKGQGNENSSPGTVTAAERIQQKFESYRATVQSSQKTTKPSHQNSEDDAKSEKVQSDPSPNADDTRFLKGIHLYPIFDSKQSAPDAAAAAAAAAAVLQDSESDQPRPQRAVVYRSAAWPSSPPIISERYEAVSPSVETVSGSSSGPAPASVAGAEMVEVPIPLQDLSPPTPAVARSFPTPFSLPTFDADRSGSAENSEVTEPPSPAPEAPPATAEQPEDADSYQVKVRLPARPSPYVPWAPGGVGSINVNFGAESAKEASDGPARGDEEGRETAAPPASESESESESGDWEEREKTQGVKDSEPQEKETEASQENEVEAQPEERVVDESQDSEDTNEVEGEPEEGGLQADQAAAAATPTSAAPFEEPAAAAVWSYRGAETGPGKWGALGFPTCGGGSSQSPINIEFDIRPAGLPPLAWRVPEDSDAFQAGGAASSARVLYNGRAVVIGGLDAVMEGGDGAEYALRAIHVHTPSEHSVGGLHYDMELHFVHSAVVDGEARYLIVAALFSRAERSADFVAGLAAALPSLAAGGEVLSVDFPAIAMAVLGQMAVVNPTTTNAESYYAYEGSFTAPPCAEGVAWRVLKNPLPVAPAHLAAFQRVQGKNNRPTQPLNGRAVLDSSPAQSQL